MTSGLVQSKTKQDGSLRTLFYWSHERTFTGFAVDVADLSRRFVVELVVDGSALRSVQATDHLNMLANDAIGDGCYGFCFSLDARTFSGAEVVEARIANTGVRVGEPVVIETAAGRERFPEPSGAVQWLGGVRFSGWIADSQESLIDIQVDGEPVTRARATSWAHVGEADHARAVRSFTVHLPMRFADGAVHRLAAVDSTGAPLQGSPLPFVAFMDGLSKAQAEFCTGSGDNVRAQIFDRLVPMSIPFAAYDEWRQTLFRPEPIAHPLKAAVISVGPGEIEDTLTSLNDQTHPDWVAVSLPGDGIRGGFDCDRAHEFLCTEAADAEVVVFIPSGTILAPDAVMRLTDVLQRHSEIIAVYGDLEIVGHDGSVWPLALPAFDYERLVEQGYCAQAFALRRSTAESALTKRPFNLYRLFNSLLDEGVAVADRIAHLPGAIAILPQMAREGASEALAAATRAHLQRRGVDARVEPGHGEVLPAAKVARSHLGVSVTIVIPTRDRRALLEACLESLRPALSRRSCEIIILDNGSTDRDTLEYLASIDGGVANVMRIDGAFNFARLNNAAALAAKGDYLCLLNNDVQALDAYWLEEMLGRMCEPDTGAVGAQLLWPSGVVQHGGVVLGANFAATHAFNDRMDGDPGYGDLLRVAHECSAVTAACLLTRRKDYIDVGGMDEFRFPVNFNDVDYCLKLRAAGKRIVFTPHAKLLHLESASRGADTRVDRKQRLDRELRNLRAKWADVLIDDPFYSPMLSLDPVPFTALAWPLREMGCRLARRPIPVHVPPGF
jgi:GT2 family glycosyltransferase